MDGSPSSRSLLRSFVRSQFSLQLRRETTMPPHAHALAPHFFAQGGLCLSPLFSTTLHSPSCAKTNLCTRTEIVSAKDSAIFDRKSFSTPPLLSTPVKSPVMEGAVAETAKRQLTFCPFRVLRSEVKWSGYAAKAMA